MPRLVLVAALLGFAACYGANQSTEAPGQSAEAPGPVPTPPDADDPPGHVGRLALIEGAASFRPAAGDTWSIPEPNRPVTTGDALWVDTTGHEEVEIGPNAFRLAHQTEVDVVHLDDDMLQLRVPQGSVDLRVKEMDIKKDYEIDAPNAAIIIDQAGEYRIDVSATGDTTRVTTRSGHAQVTASGSSFPVDVNQTATIRGDSGTAITYDLAAAGAPDDFDTWSHDRDDKEDRVSASSHYASTDMGGVEELDAYGSWQNNPDYGAVWFPTTVEVGWAPYSYGDWVWVDPWGWTWVDSYPWGWAPFHYGRWAFVGGAWGWCPGPFGYDPFWSPGLVAFVGGGGWGLGVGWFPLGWREPYVPWYRTDIRYRERINFNSVTNVTNIEYRNRGIPGAVTAVPTRSFGGGEAIGRGAAIHPTGAQLAGAGVLGGGPGVAPTRGALVGSRAFSGPSAVPPSRLATRSTVALHAPPPAAVRFSAEESKIAANGGRPLTGSERANIRETDASARVNEPIIHSAAQPIGGRGLTPARPGLAPSRPVSQGFAPRQGRTSLDQSFGAERQQLEARHMQEFANPRTDESRNQMYQRQEAEHRELVNRYNTARSSGLTRMPPAPHFSGGHRR
jgi:hypothetical protein